MDQPSEGAAGVGPDNRQDIQIFVYSDLEAELENSRSSQEESSAGGESNECEDSDECEDGDECEDSDECEDRDDCEVSEEGRIPEQRESEEYRRLEAEALSYLGKLMDYADMLAVKSAAPRPLQEAEAVQDRTSDLEISVGVEFPSRSGSEPELLTPRYQTDVEMSSTACSVAESPNSTDSGVPGAADEDAVVAWPPSLVPEYVDCFSIKDEALSVPGEDDATSVPGEDDATLLPGEDDVPVLSQVGIGTHFLCSVKSAAKPLKCGPKSPRAAGSSRKLRGAGEERRYACDRCEAEFKRPISLRRHKERASGDARCRCEVCGKDFCERIALGLHRNIQHSAENRSLNACNECGKVLATKFSLNRHMHSVHERPSLSV